MVVRAACHLLGRGLLVLLAVFMLLQAALFGAVVWLHAPPGQKMLRQEIATALDGSGYSLTFGSIGYRPFNAIALKDVVLTDADGASYGVDYLRLRVGLSPLLNRTLLLGVRIGTVTLTSGSSAPSSSPATASAPMAPFELPDIYLRAVVLRGLQMKRLVSDGDTVFENLSLKGRADIGERLSLALDGGIKGVAEVFVSAAFDPRDLSVVLDQLTVAATGIDVTGHGRADLSDKGQADVTLSARMADLSSFSPSLAGDGEISLHLGGSSLAPDLSARGQIRLAGDAYRDLAPVDIRMDVRDVLSRMVMKLGVSSSYLRTPVSLTAEAENKGGALSVNKIVLALPGLRTTGQVSVQTRDMQINGRLSTAIRDLGVLAPGLPPEYSPRGTVNAVFKGHDLDLDGRMALAGRNIGLRGKLSLLPDAEVLEIRNFRLTDGAAGWAQAEGRYGYGGTPDADIRLQLRGFNLPMDEPLQGVVTGDLALSQRGDAYRLSGTLTPDRLDITIPERFGSTIPALNVTRPGQKKPDAPDFLRMVETDISIVAPKRIFVRGWGLDAEFGGTVTVTERLDDPQVNGSFSSLRGRFEEFGKRFTIDHADLRFQGSVPPSPYLDIKAVITTDGVEAAVLLTGPVAKPELGFSSVPSLPKDEVLARILFGRDMRRLSPFEAIRLADTLRRLSGQGSSGGFNPLNAFRNAIGLDDLRVDQDSNGQTSVGAGKYISDKVYIELKKGSGADTGAASVNIDLTRNIKVETEVGQSKGAGGGISWQWDY